MDAVEGLGLLARHADTLLRHDAEPGVLDESVDLAGQIALGGVRLDDGECAFGRHGRVVSSSSSVGFTIAALIAVGRTPGNPPRAP
jgi:hypothetical protein